MQTKTERERWERTCMAPVYPPPSRASTMVLMHFVTRYRELESIEQLLLLGSVFFFRNQSLRLQPFQHLKPFFKGQGGWSDSGSASGRWSPG